jgi:small nuclear ribonucleoprotein (snRNP)-like protein
MDKRMTPIGMLDGFIGSRVWIIMKTEKEIFGMLRGFDDYMRS